MATGDDVFMSRVPSRPAKGRVERRGVEPYDIRFGIRRPVVPSGDVDDFVVHVRGDIVFVESGTEEAAGSIDAYVLQVDRARDAGEDVWEICDATSANLFEVCEAVFDESGELKDEVCDGGLGSNVLFLDRAEILPAHRGRGLGLMALLRTIEDFGRGCAVAVMKPFPLQLEGVNERSVPSALDAKYRRSMALDALEPNPARARRSLERHWSKLGFERFAETELFLLDLAMQRPTYANLLTSDD